MNLPKETVCLDIHYGCSGYIYGLFQAALWINSTACNNVLILVGENSSSLINPKDRSLRMVFGDCGTATLMKKGQNTFGFVINSDGSGHDKLIIPAGGARKPFDEKTSLQYEDEDGNYRTEEDLFMDGMAIFNFAINEVPTNINNVIDFMTWDKQDVNLFALHQANKFIVNAIRKKMRLESKIVPFNVKDYGNTGPSTIP